MIRSSDRGSVYACVGNSLAGTARKVNRGLVIMLSGDFRYGSLTGEFAALGSRLNHQPPSTPLLAILVTVGQL